MIIRDQLWKTSVESDCISCIYMFIGCASIIIHDCAILTLLLKDIDSGFNLIYCYSNSFKLFHLVQLRYASLHAFYLYL